MTESCTEFEREKWVAETDARNRELAIKEREASIKEGELDIKKSELAIRQEEAKHTLTNSPLKLAILGAVLTGIANILVSCYNGNAQRELERSQAEHSRLASAINANQIESMDRLRFLIKNGLVTEEPTRTNILAYIDQQQQAPNPGPAQPAQAPPPSAPVARLTLDSPWLDGGHNQSEVCNGLIGDVRSRYPNKDIRIVGMSEDSRKDFIGHVTYKYHCQFAVF
jgi:hypothetical protein